MRENYREIEGILPIYKYSNQGYWYEMPLATPILEHIRTTKSTIKDIVCGIAQLAHTLSLLHQKQLSHRDIKPANIYFYNDRYYLGDFGLVDIPDDANDLTRSNKALGAVFTMAPEMRRDPKHADGRKADVYSLAKSLWILITGKGLGFDGQYNYNDREISLDYLVKDRNAYFVEIDELLVKATDNKPENRPDMEEFEMQLRTWIEVLDNVEIMDKNRWDFLNRVLFGGGYVPRTAVWEDPHDIVKVLNSIPLANSYSHMLFSSKGGLDFHSSKTANESGCIYIEDDIGGIHLVKPKSLYYESFRDAPEWNYFFLEVDPLDPVFSENTDEEYETLVEDYPGNYVSAKGYYYGVYDYETGEKLPDSSKLIHRYLCGSFLFVLKTGPYNHISSTYDGRHGKYKANQFRKYTEDIKEMFNKVLDLSGGDNETAAHVISRITGKRIKDEEPDSASEEIKKAFLSGFQNWDFSEALEYERRLSSMRFWIILDTDVHNLTLKKEDSHILCEDGFFHPYVESEKPLFIDNRESAIQIKTRIEKEIIEKLPNGYTEFSDYYINIGIRIYIGAEKFGKPSHLFTQDEMLAVMQNADDRNNNTMVIDEKGFVQIVPNLQYGNLYPVTFEMFCAGNNYVGKYADLSNINSYYHMALSHWLRYLKKGKHCHVDVDICEKNCDDLKTEILKYY